MERGGETPPHPHLPLPLGEGLDFSNLDLKYSTSGAFSRFFHFTWLAYMLFIMYAFVAWFA